MSSCEALLQFGQQSWILLSERLTVVLLLFRTHITPGSKHETVFTDYIDRFRFAETEDVEVDPCAVLRLIPRLRRWFAAPLAEGVDHASDVGIEIWVAHAVGEHRLAV